MLPPNLFPRLGDTGQDNLHQFLHRAVLIQRECTMFVVLRQYGR